MLRKSSNQRADLHPDTVKDDELPQYRSAFLELRKIVGSLISKRFDLICQRRNSIGDGGGVVYADGKILPPPVLELPPRRWEGRGGILLQKRGEIPLPSLSTPLSDATAPCTRL